MKRFEPRLDELYMLWALFVELPDDDAQWDDGKEAVMALAESVLNAVSSFRQTMEKQRGGKGQGKVGAGSAAGAADEMHNNVGRVVSALESQQASAALVEQKLDLLTTACTRIVRSLSAFLLPSSFANVMCRQLLWNLLWLTRLLLLCNLLLRRLWMFRERSTLGTGGSPALRLRRPRILLLAGGCNEVFLLLRLWAPRERFVVDIKWFWPGPSPAQNRRYAREELSVVTSVFL